MAVHLKDNIMDKIALDSGSKVFLVDIILERQRGASTND
jgi:hypothetical protein